MLGMLYLGQFPLLLLVRLSKCNYADGGVLESYI